MLRFEIYLKESFPTIHQQVFFNVYYIILLISQIFLLHQFFFLSLLVIFLSKTEFSLVLFFLHNQLLYKQKSVIKIKMERENGLKKSLSGKSRNFALFILLSIVDLSSAVEREKESMRI